MSAQANSSQTIQSAINRLTGGTAFEQKHVQDLHGKVTVVTGGTAGIGFEVAKTLALAGARVVAISRKEHDVIENVNEAAQNAEDHTGTVDIRFVECDFGNMAQVKSVADKLAQDESRIDMLINDAGIGVSNYAMDSDGIERIFGVNVVGHFLLINRLLPLLRKTAQQSGSPPRLISLTSNLHKLAPSSCKFESLEEINDENLPRADHYYDRSKLAIILYIKALVRHAIEPFPEKIIALSVHPGAVSTEIQGQIRQAFGDVLGSAFIAVQKPLFRAPDEGSLGTLWAAVSPEVETMGLQGEYIPDPGKVGGETEQAKDMALAENVWKLCHALIQERLGQDALYPWNEGSDGVDAKVI